MVHRGVLKKSGDSYAVKMMNIAKVPKKGIYFWLVLQ